VWIPAVAREAAGEVSAGVSAGAGEAGGAWALLLRLEQRPIRCGLRPRRTCRPTPRRGLVRAHHRVRRPPARALLRYHPSRRPVRSALRYPERLRPSAGTTWARRAMSLGLWQVRNQKQGSARHVPRVQGGGASCV
jgi:hypothetical protein